jgi:hypothetical protein
VLKPLLVELPLGRRACLAAQITDPRQRSIRAPQLKQ